MRKKIAIVVVMVTACFASVHAGEGNWFEKHIIDGSCYGVVNMISSPFELLRTPVYRTRCIYYSDYPAFCIVGPVVGLVEGAWLTTARLLIGFLDIPTFGGIGELCHTDYFPKSFWNHAPWKYEPYKEYNDGTVNK